jgi:hypothetical protein
LLERLRIDDPVSCVPVHLCAGVWSLIAVVFFLEKDKSGNFHSKHTVIHNGRWELLGAQVALIVASGAWSACVTLFLLTMINFFIPIRMSLADELKGSDKCEHGISLCSTFEITRGHSAYGTRRVSRTDWENQDPIEAGSLSLSTSNQSGSPGNTPSVISSNQYESGNRGDLVRRSPLHISDEPIAIASITVHSKQTTGQLNGGFNTDL